MRRLWFEGALLPSGWARDVELCIVDESFAQVTAGVAAHPAAERHAVAIPGTANLHSHAFQRAAAGRTGRPGPQGDSFWTWRAEIYRLAARLEPDDVEAIAALSYAEMLEAGFTRVGEFHYLHHAPDGAPYADPAEMAARHLVAAEAVGVDITLLPVFYAHGDVGGGAPAAGQARFVCSLERYAATLDACRGHAARIVGASLGVAPHSLRAVTRADLDAVTDLAADGPIHIHVAEQTAEVERCLAVLGARPVEWLLANAAVDRRWCLVHATHVTAAETRAIAAAGATVGLCPITEADLGDGVFPAAEFIALGGVWGVGSDSNVLIDLASELRLLEYGQRLTKRRRNLLCEGERTVGRSLFDGARGGGARALGCAETGLSMGAPASFVTLSTNDPAMAEACEDASLDAWIFAARRSPIDEVWVRGRRRVEHGRHITRDAIDRQYRARIRSVLAD